MIQLQEKGKKKKNPEARIPFKTALKKNNKQTTHTLGSVSTFT